MAGIDLNSGIMMALMETGIIVLIGYICRRVKLLNSSAVDVLTKLILYVCLPSLIFYSFIAHLNRGTLSPCFISVIFSLLLFALGFSLGYLIYTLFIRKGGLKREFLLLSSFQNSGYLPLALIAYLLSGEQLEYAFLLILSYLLGFNLIMLSFGYAYIKDDGGLKLKDFLSLPFVFSVISAGLALSGVGKYIPSSILQPLYKVGSTTIPLSMLLLGAIFAGSRILNFSYLKELLLLILSKQLLLPLVVIFILKASKPLPLVSFVIFLESAMPSATMLSVIASHRRANVDFVSQGILFTHLFLLLTLPFMFELFKRIYLCPR